MRVINHNWSATKQCLHPQSVAEISRHSVLSADRIQQCETSSGSHHETQISVCKSPFPSASTALSLFLAKTVQQRPLLPREVETLLLDCGPEPTSSYASYAAVKSRKMAPVFRLCWNLFSMKVVRAATWSQVLRPFPKAAW